MNDTHDYGGRIRSIEQDVVQVVALLTTLTRAVDALTQNTKVENNSDTGGEERKEPTPSRWAWQHADPEQAAWLWAGLVPWVRWASDRYPTALRDLPPCWHLHSDAVEELTALWASWRAAFHGDDLARDDMIYWHDRWFPATTTRLLGPTGVLINCAKAQQHRAPNLAGAARYQFNHIDVPTVEEHAATDITHHCTSSETAAATGVR